MEAMYVDDTYARQNPTWHEEDSPWKAKQITSIIRRNQVPTKTICEVGCGTGEILLNLSNEFQKAKLTGYEISPQAYARAKQKETSAVSFVFDDFTKAETEKQDVVILADVIEHVEDCISFLKSLRGRSAYTILHIPLDLSVQSLLRSWPIMRLRKDVGHIHYFYKESALALLRDCGFEIVDYAYTASRLELPNQAFSSKLVRLPRRAFFSLNPDLTVRVLGGYSLLVLAR